MSKGKAKFDQDKAFKNILGISETEDSSSLVPQQENTSVEKKENALSLNIKSQEKKTRRASLLLKPSVYSKAIKRCNKEKVSFNDVVNQLLEVWTSH